MEQQLKPGLTQADIAAQQKAEMAEKIGTTLPTGLAEALAEEEMLLQTRSLLRKVPEFIFRRDILPAIVGSLGQVDMRWWVKQFGSVTLGFLVVKDSDHSEVLFEFPAMAPSNQAELNSDKRPVGDIIADYNNRASIRPTEAKDELKKELRDFIHPGGALEFIENIGRVERICRHYDETILKDCKPEFKAIIDQAVEGLDEALGKLGTEVKKVPSVPEKAVAEGENDDDGEAPSELYD